MLSMGPEQASYALRECLAMGADNAYLLGRHVHLEVRIPVPPVRALAYGVKKIGDYDFIFAGRQAIDGDTAQVGPQLAQRLELPIATYVQNIREIREKTVIVERQLEDGYKS